MSLEKKTRENNPDASAEALFLASQIDENADIKALADTPGGKKLAELLIRDVVGTVHTLAGQYESMTLPEMQAKCARLSAQLNLATVIVSSTENDADLRKQLEDALSQ